MSRFYPHHAILRNRTCAVQISPGTPLVIFCWVQSLPLLWQTSSLQVSPCRGGEPMGRPVVHFEIGCRNSKKTQEFYTKMFGWTITEAGPAAMIAPEAPGIGGHGHGLWPETSAYTTS